jgi:hypothetical protein
MLTVRALIHPQLQSYLQRSMLRIFILVCRSTYPSAVQARGSTSPVPDHVSLQSRLEKQDLIASIYLQRTTRFL